MTLTTPIITVTNCENGLLINADATQQLNIVEQSVTQICNSDEYSVNLEVGSDIIPCDCNNFYLTGGTYTGGYVYFSGIGTNFIVDLTPLIISTGYGLTGATLSGDTLILTNTAGFSFYIDFSQFNYSDEINYLDGKIDSHTGNTNNPHQTTFNNLVNTAHTHSISDITGIDDRYVNVTGDTMTGNLVINANLYITGNTYITSLEAVNERIITTSGSSLLQNYLTTDSEFTVDTTIISNLLAPYNWDGKLYSGTTIGFTEGQEYIGPDYRYTYQNSTVTRYKLESDTFIVYTTAATISSSVNIVLCNNTSPFTLYLPEISTCNYSQLFVKNINTGTVTLSATTGIDGSATKTLIYNDSLHLGVNRSSYYVISDSIYHLETYITGATMSGDTLIIYRNDGTLIYTDLSQFNYNDEIQYLDSKIDYHTGNTNNPHQTTFNNLVNTAHTHSISDITGIDDRYVNVTGDTMTGNLVINANLYVTGDTYLQQLSANTVYVTSLGADSERIITTSGSSLLQNYLTTNNSFITSTTIISSLIAPYNWNGQTYTGTTIGITEGQEYIGPNYRYTYQNSTVTRYAIDTDVEITYTTAATISVSANIILCSSLDPFTLLLPDPSTMVYSQRVVKNINTGIVTLSATTLIDGVTYKTLTQWDALHLYNNRSTYYII